ncbi:MAG: hypothetical protein MI802_23015, partial [Desulfobacterales bacterium]|nr:hypothetical protein [Desulfobacterales bacterium]
FVNPSNLALADMITQGFLNAYADGSYPRFFYNHPLIRPALEKADLHHRIRIEIPNLFLTPETKSIPRQYWHSK